MAISGDALLDDFQIKQLEFAEANPPIDNVSSAEDEATLEPQISKARKRRLKAKEAKKRKKAKLEEEYGEDSEDVIESSIALAPTEIQSDHLSQKQALTFPKLSSLEKSDIDLAANFFVDTTSIGPSVRASLSSFLKNVNPELSKTLSKPCKVNGSPRVLVIAAAALRVADLCRDLKPLSGTTEVTKLFSKHFKLEEHLHHVSKTGFNVACGTPDRIGKLLEVSEELRNELGTGQEKGGTKSKAREGLSINSLALLVLDVSHLDDKKRDFFSIPESRDALFKMVLKRSEIMERLRNGRMKLLLY